MNTVPNLNSKIENQSTEFCNLPHTLYIKPENKISHARCSLVPDILCECNDYRLCKKVNIT